MTYLLALIAVVAVAVLCWKAFGPQRPPRITAGKTARRDRIIGPDDDPEFLWRISRQHRNRDTGSDS
ncbi:hypothetical protein [Nocardia terpenica]|uniref:Uncharacterized protein n=1 Tax=Nocardia terpenica TaxID=455432 RepID=A0A291RTR1_9NOCA|nr:hypothetical protein [Nocardia terpenica]ATL70926.1 hypothetical protein CRH09_36825 [Nocardia terpenica]QIS23036.1 hypothetical protein F6W96_36540 [Nocardia terpenica]